MMSALAAFLSKKAAASSAPPPPPPPTGEQQARLTIDQIVETSGWNINSLSNLQWTGVDDDQTAEYHAAANGTTDKWLRASFPAPGGYPLSTQKFLVRAAGSISGFNLVVSLYENGTLVRDVGTVALGTSAATYEFAWAASELTNNTGADVEIRVRLQDNNANGYYTVWWIAWDATFAATPDAQEYDEELAVASVDASSAWTISDLPDIQDFGASNPDATTSDRGSVNGGTAWARFGFATPSGTLTGTQTFKVRVRGTASGMNIIVKVAENGTVKQTFSSQALTTSQTTYSFTWNASILSNSSGADVQIEVHLSDNVASQVYMFAFISWVAHIAGTGTGVVTDGQLTEPFDGIDLNTSGTTNLAKPWNFHFEQANLRTFTVNGAHQYWTRDGETKAGNTISDHLSGAGHGSPPHLHKVVDGVLRLQAFPAPSALASALTTELGGYSITHVAGMVSTERSLAKNRGIWSVRARALGLGRGARLIGELVPADGSQSQKIRFLDLPGHPFAEGSFPAYRTLLIGWTNGPSFVQSGASVVGQLVQIYENSADLQTFHTYEVQINDDGNIIFSRDGVVSRIQANQFSSTSWYLVLALEANSTVTGYSPEGLRYIELDHVSIRSLTPTIAWPGGWPAAPPLGSFHGIGQAFNYAYNSSGQLVWAPLQDYNSWLGRPANIVKAWPNSSSTGGWANWDGIAGGAGDADNIWGGQLNEVNPSRALDPSWWPVTAPFVLGLGAVPTSHGNRQNGAGQWSRPGIWQEIARGDYDWAYRKLFRRLATRCGQIGRDPRTIVIRWCWEANGNWYPHSIGPDKASFIAAWRRCMDIMRSSVGAVLGAGKSFMIEFGPSGHLRFGSGTSERLWNVYPGDDWVDVCGLGIHDQVGISIQADWDEYLHYPASIAGTTFEGIIDWFDFAVSRGKWVGTSEIESNYIARTYFPKTQNMNVMWTTGFEPVRNRYAGKFLYFIYLWNGDSALKRPDNWGQPYKLLYQ